MVRSIAVLLGPAAVFVGSVVCTITCIWAVRATEDTMVTTPVAALTAEDPMVDGQEDTNPVASGVPAAKRKERVQTWGERPYSWKVFVPTGKYTRGVLTTRGENTWLHNHAKTHARKDQNRETIQQKVQTKGREK
jgi:hypothetical protein